jgi:hypothetical protein
LACHFPGDPVMTGCLGLDAMWQVIGYCLAVSDTRLRGHPHRRAWRMSKKAKPYLAGTLRGGHLSGQARQAGVLRGERPAVFGRRLSLRRQRSQGRHDRGRSIRLQGSSPGLGSPHGPRT